ncbi:MAG: GxxExxY protein [Ignavibacteria bacterium]|jgi:GxxExxY protein
MFTTKTQSHEELSSEEYVPLSDEEERIATKIVDAAYQVHSRLGPGLLESVYEVCFCHELKKAGLNIKSQVSLPLYYDNIKFESAYRLDVLVEDSVICELKAIDALLSIHEAQLLSYMKLSKIRLGFLINFNVHIIKKGIKRKILSL